MKKRMLATLLALYMALTMLPSEVLAVNSENTIVPDETSDSEQDTFVDTEELVELVDEPTSGTCGENLTWTLDSNGILTISGSGEMSDYEVLNSAPWYRNCSEVVMVVIEDGITHIGNYSFYNCKELQSITLPDSLLTIGNWTFYGCEKLISINFPHSVISIGDSAFARCLRMTHITIPDGVTHIGAEAFYYCSSLLGATLPGTLRSIGNGLFLLCGNIKTIGLGEGITEIPERMFASCSKLARVTMPNSLTSIGYAAFLNCSTLQNIEIPDTVVHIAHDAFRDCSALAHISIPEGVTSVGQCGFSGCSSMTNISLPSSISIIEEQAFSGCSSLSDVYYQGTIDQWNSIVIQNSNDKLFSTTIHYNSTGPDDIGSDSMNTVYFLCGWDVTTRTVQFGDSESTPDTYTVANGVDVSNISSLLNKYVLVTMESDGSSLEYTITDIQPVESRIGTVSATGEHSLTIDGTTYPVRQDSLLVSGMYDGKEILYHVSNGTIVGFNMLEEKSGTLETWDSATGQATIDGTAYPTNYLSDLSFQNNISGYLQKGVYFVTSGSSDYHPLLRITGFYYPGGKLEDFNADIYHATWLSKHGNAADMLEDKTPSEILIDVVSEGHGDLAMDMWRSLNLVFETLDDVDSLREFKVKPRDLYSALILDALEASVSIDVVASEYEDALGKFKRCLSDFSTFVKKDQGIDLNNSDEFQDIVSRMPGVDVDAYTEKFISNWYKTNYPSITDISKSLGYISKGLKAVGTLEDFTEYCAECVTLMQISDSMKYVLERACLKSAEIYGPTDNMTQAFNDCLQMITRSSDEMFDQIEKKAVSVVGWAGYQYLVNEVLWAKVSQQIQVSCPEIAILKLIYKAENTICNKLFKTEDAAEKYLKMDGIVNIESIINAVYRDLEFTFDRTPTLEGAKRYLSAMELSFRLRDVDCKTSNEYVENVQSSLVGSIKELLGAADYESLKQCINSIQSEYSTHYTLAETGWVPYLEEDYPGSGLYELYSALYETILGSGGDVKLVKQFTAACPVNVYVYDQSDNIVASVVNGRVSCSVDDVMIALVDDQKIIRFYDGADYRIEYVGNDTGDMDVTITEFDENKETTRTVNYYNLALTNGKTYTIGADDDTLKPYNLTDKSDNSTVQHDYDSMDTNAAHTIKIVSGTLQQGGELFAETTASKGETLQLNAYVPEGYEFVRWESSSTNALIADINSVNTTLIMPDEDLAITAIIRETHSPSTAHTVRFDPNGGTLSGSAILVTSTSGKLSNLPTATRSSYTFDGWYTEISGGDKVTVNYVFTSDTTVYAHWTKNSGGSSGGSSSGGGSSGGSSTYPPTVSKPSEGGGAVTVSPSSPKQGDTVTVTPNPDEGNEVDKITVTDPNGKAVEVKHNPDGTYTFIQPNGKVKIEVTYKPIDGSWSNPFTDVAEGSWYYAAVRFIQENGLMGGYGDGRFGPNDNLSRAQLAQILFNREGRPVVNYLMKFGDVTSEAWYAEAVRWAASQGIVSGYGNGMFGPNDPITREQLAVMLWRYSGSPAATNKELHFNDTDEISGFALEAMRWAVEHGIVNGYGDGRLGPKGQATRAQVAQMLKNYLER